MYAYIIIIIFYQWMDEEEIRQAMEQEILEYLFFSRRRI